MIRLRVKEIAHEKGITQSKLGRMADIDTKTLRRIYKEPTTRITFPVLERLAKALNVPVTDLLEDVPE